MARIIFVIALLIFTSASFAQIREVPSAVKDAFQAQYPVAEQVEFKDNIVNVQVQFVLKGEKMMASYNNKGVWKETEKEWSFDKLPEAVKDGFKKSKYMDWEVLETKVVYQPGGTELLKIKVAKGDIKRKNLYFNGEGRLISDLMTL